MLKVYKTASPQASADDDQQAYYAYIEAYRYDESTEIAEKDIWSGRLEAALVEDWAWQKKTVQHPPQQLPLRSCNGGLRILFSQPKATILPINPESFISSSVIEALHLPQVAHTSFDIPSGISSIHSHPKGSSLEDCSGFGVVLRTPQKWECSLGSLTTYHNFDTGITTALILGWGFAIDEYGQKPSAPLSTFLRQIRDCPSELCHPLFLPSIFLIQHTLRVQSFIRNTLLREVVQVERRIGVTRAGLSHLREHPISPISLALSSSSPSSYPSNSSPNLYASGKLQRANAQKLTATINDLSTWLIFTHRSPKWDIECVDFLLNILSTCPRLSSVYRGASEHVFRETLEYARGHSQASLEQTESSRARMQLQLEILYTAVAQDDGLTSAKLAALAGRDSTSMKILALITAAYLPGTFVASLFSTGMFEWFGNVTGTVADSFWIYWAVAIPLTVLTLFGWFIWWRVEEARFDRRAEKL